MNLPAHSKIGASSCERWFNCPGSVTLLSTLPPQKESLYAAEGTAAHELGERCLRDKINAFELVGEFSSKGIEFTEEMADAVQVYLDTIRGDMANTGGEIEIEHKFHLKHIDQDAFGTNDCNLRVFLSKLIVYDYKHGAGVPIEAVGNKQCLYYLLGAAIEGDYQEFEVVIVQPRADHRDGPVRRWTVTKEELANFAKELKDRIALVKTETTMYRSGPWCAKSFCAAAAICPALKKQVDNAAMTVFGAVEAPVLRDPNTLTPLQMRRLLDAIPMIDAWLKSVEAHAEACAMRGEEILGYKLVQKRSNRKWADETKTEDVLRIYSSDIYAPRKLLSPAQMEKALGKEYKREIEQLTVKPDAGLTLVPESDKREAVAPQATTAFLNEIN